MPEAVAEPLIASHELRQLLVDLLQRLLEREGYEVVTAVTGEELDLGRRFDAVVVPYMVPDDAGHANVLRLAIESVRWQTFSDWELWVIGDACTDDTAEVVASFADPRIHFFNLPANVGEQSGPNNEGFRRTRGRCVAYLNHDDLWFPDHLAGLTRFIDETGHRSAFYGGHPFLGLDERDLPARGLRAVEEHGQRFWIPDMEVMRTED